MSGLTSGLRYTTTSVRSITLRGSMSHARCITSPHPLSFTSSLYIGSPHTIDTTTGTTTGEATTIATGPVPLANSLTVETIGMVGGSRLTPRAYTARGMILFRPYRIKKKRSW